MRFALFFALGAACMEPVAWAMHKFAFHGPLWFLHKSHHEPSAGGRSRWRIEANDSFSLIFAAIAIGFMSFSGERWMESPCFAFGCGVTAFGMSYFAMHDAFVHRRFVPFKSAGKWMDAVRDAHRVHHRSIEKKADGPFGLFVPWDYEKSSGVSKK